mmetsp:Transcript_2211/g.2764  ORF Transcript_2211/g.2764 Transcript_2211/m.2764 type:complete len:217 (-) Transcript_2211:196-846(-)
MATSESEPAAAPKGISKMSAKQLMVFVEKNLSKYGLKDEDLEFLKQQEGLDGKKLLSLRVEDLKQAIKVTSSRKRVAKFILTVRREDRGGSSTGEDGNISPYFGTLNPSTAALITKMEGLLAKGDSEAMKMLSTALKLKENSEKKEKHEEPNSTANDKEKEMRTKDLEIRRQTSPYFGTLKKDEADLIAHLENALTAGDSDAQALVEKALTEATNK